MNSSLGSSSIEGYFDSRMVQITAGSDNKVFHIHAAALSTSESASLRALVSEKWDPTGDTTINWTHTDSATVVRFFTYLYTGGYQIPTPEPRFSESELSQAMPLDKDDESTSFSVENTLAEDLAAAQSESEASSSSPTANTTTENIGEHDDSDLNVQTALVESFETRPLTPLGLSAKVTPASCNPTGIQPSFDNAAFSHESHDYTQPMLALAKLYCFASYHLCSSLQNSTSQRMGEILMNIDCSVNSAAAELVEVIKHVYENTASNSAHVDAMRDLLSQFVAINYTDLMHDKFEDLIIRGGDFAVDIARKVRRALHGIEKSKQDLKDKNSALDLEVESLRRNQGLCSRCRKRGGGW